MSRRPLRLASLKSEGRDGTLAVVSPDGEWLLAQPENIPTLQFALETWAEASPRLRVASERLARIPASGERRENLELHSPLPRAYQWCEGSTYLPHMERIRAARGLPLPLDYLDEPTVYQSGSDSFLGPLDAIPLRDPAWGLDIEATLAVVTDDVPMGTTVDDAALHIKLVLLANDLTFRHILPREFAKGVGLYQAKPARSFAPFAAAPSWLGDRWDGTGLAATVKTWVNGEVLGALETREDCGFDFARLIAHLTRTRALAAGTIVGSGTISNRDPSRGFGCLFEKQAVEAATTGKVSTSLLDVGDSIRIEAFADGVSLFGAIEQSVVQAAALDAPVSVLSRQTLRVNQ